MLAVEGLGVRIAGRQVLDGVDFAVAPGEFTGLIGSNGAGKTTLFRVILGLQPATAGGVLVGGRPRSGAPTRSATCRRSSCSTPTCRCAGATWSALGLDGAAARRRRSARAPPARAVEEMLDAVDAERVRRHRGSAGSRAASSSGS